MKREKIFRYPSEAEMCQAFMEWAEPQGWTWYPETGGFDILGVRKFDGYHLGIEAKQRLNVDVVRQILMGAHSEYTRSGPDYRAVLVPAGGSADFAMLLPLVGVTVIRANDPAKGKRDRFTPRLPVNGHSSKHRLERHDNRDWLEWCPPIRHRLPEYIPDVQAGASAPRALTEWKIKAIKMAVLVRRLGTVTPAHFRALDLHMSRWTQGGWLVNRNRGVWEIGPHLPDFEAMHPVNYRQIEDDFEKWSAPVISPAAGDLFGSGEAA